MSDYTDSDREQANWREIVRLREFRAEPAEQYYMLELDHAVEVRAIARVRELCFAIDGRESVTVDDVLRALDGSTE